MPPKKAASGPSKKTEQKKKDKVIEVSNENEVNSQGYMYVLVYCLEYFEWSSTYA